MINAFLEKIGYQVFKIKPSFSYEFNKKLIVEFVGPPGVGKSYLYNNLNLDSIEFITIDSFRKLKDNQMIKDSKIERIYDEICKYRFETVTNQEISFKDKFRGIYWNYKVILDDQFLLESSRNYKIILEEGLLHNFYDYFLKNDIDDYFFKNRVIIFCEATPEIMVDRILDRYRKTDRIIAHHKDQPKDKLLGIVQNEIKKYNEFKDILIEKKICILSINTSENIENNINKIVRFLNNFK